MTPVSCGGVEVYQVEKSLFVVDLALKFWWKAVIVFT
jgi:hypothetical protein